MAPAITGSPPGNDNAERGLGKVGKPNSNQQPEFSANDTARVKHSLMLHQLCELFPRMADAEIDTLKADIAANGLNQPLITLGGKILDGGNRYRACVELGIEPATVEYSGTDPIAFVLSANLHRRHLTESQRAMIAASMANLPRGGIRPGQNTGASQTANLQSEVSQSQAADMLQVSPRSVATAAKVERESPAEVVEAVKSGAMSLNLASQVAELPKEDQEIVAAAPAEQIKEAAREAVHNHRAQGTGENEWYTPSEYIEAAREVMGGIDVDPASSDIAQKTIQADEFFTIDDDGLKREWNGRVWLNPPYAQPAIHHFMQKAVDEFEAGRMKEGIALTHNYTDTQWFHLAAKVASAICFTRGRIGFVNPEGKRAAPTQGQAFFYFGDKPEDFADRFCNLGTIAFFSQPSDDLIADAERLIAENRALQERVDVLTADNQAAKLNEWITKYHQLDAHLGGVNKTLSEAKKDATSRGNTLAKIRKFLGVDSDSEILPKLKEGA